MKFFTLKIHFPVLLIFLLSFCALEAISHGATLIWDKNTEEDLAGYKIYYGTSSGNYQSVIDIGNVTEYRFSFLNEGLTYYTAVTAYDIYGNESDSSTELDFFIMEDGVPDDYDNCPQTPNGPDNGTCTCRGELCMSDADCECGSCSMNQEDTDGDGLGDVCDSSPYVELCQSYCNLCETCIDLKNDGRNLDYYDCRSYNNQTDCEAAKCYWNHTIGLPDGACVVDICLSDSDFSGETDGMDLSPLKKEMGRIDCACKPGGDLCQKYSDLFNYCVDLSNDGRNLDYYDCRSYNNQTDCEAAKCYWNHTIGLPDGACVVDICLSDSDFSGEIDGMDLSPLKKEMGRIDCACKP